MKSLLKAFTEKKIFFFFYLLHTLCIINSPVRFFITESFCLELLNKTRCSLMRSSSCISHCPHSSSLLCLSFPHPESSSSFPTCHLFWWPSVQSQWGEACTMNDQWSLECRQAKLKWPWCNSQCILPERMSSSIWHLLFIKFERIWLFWYHIIFPNVSEIC